MDTSKLKPKDPRVQYLKTTVRGKTYSYILGEPKGAKTDTIVLIHGFPDIAYGWRYQIPYLMSLGFQVVVPNMVGYAGTDAPEDISEYTLKSVSDDINDLARQFVGEGQIILGGHDWGGAAVWRAAFWYPKLIKAVFNVCTPFQDLSTEYVPLEDIIAAGHLPNFKYQLQFKGPELEARIQGKDKLRQFFNAIYDGRGPDNERGFDASVGILFDNMDKIESSRLLSSEELEHYVEQYSLHKAPEMRGPLSWYRMRELNHHAELDRARNGPPVRFEMPALFVTATHDVALPPSMSQGMEQYFADLSRAEVDATHWVLTEASGELNAHIGKWLDNKVSNGAIKAAL